MASLLSAIPVYATAINQNVDDTCQYTDSGGALVNSAGQVIGMITAGEAQGFRSTSSTVAYSITTNAALGVVNRARQAPT